MPRLPHVPIHTRFACWATLIGVVAIAAPMYAQQYEPPAGVAPIAAQLPSSPSADAPEAVRTTYTSAASALPQPPGLLPTGTTPRAATSLTPQDGKPKTRLAPPGGAPAPGGTQRTGTTGGALTVIASLAVVLGLFVSVVWVMRRGMPQQNRKLPKAAVESLGHIPFPGRQQGQLLRIGNKLVLVSFSTAGADVITEVTDPLEVDRLAGLCAQNDPHGAVRSFRDVVDGFFREKPGRAESSTSRRRAEEDDVA
jgi:flagellar protein FliO/FliZ